MVFSFFIFKSNGTKTQMIFENEGRCLASDLATPIGGSKG